MRRKTTATLFLTGAIALTTLAPIGCGRNDDTGTGTNTTGDTSGSGGGRVAPGTSSTVGSGVSGSSPFNSGAGGYGAPGAGASGERSGLDEIRSSTIGEGTTGSGLGIHHAQPAAPTTAP